MAHLLLFDLDGTLSDTHGMARATWLEVLRPRGIDVDFKFYQDNIRGDPTKRRSGIFFRTSATTSAGSY